MHDLHEILGSGNYTRLGEESGIDRRQVGRVLRGDVPDSLGLSLGAAHRLASAAEITLDELHDYITSQRESRLAA